MADSTDGLLITWFLDRKGGGTPGTWKDVEEWSADDSDKRLLWIHLDRTSAEAQRWVHEDSGIDELVCSALLADESRPRSLVVGDGMLVDLRGVNLNAGAEPDDMISMRMFIEPNRIVTLRRRRLMAIQDVQAELKAGTGPTSPGEFLVAIVDSLDRRMATSLSELDDRIDGLDERILAESGAGLRTEISNLRRDVIALRRYLSPQKDVVTRLQLEKVSWLSPLNRQHLREVADRTTRRVEDLDSARERASVAHEELNGRMAENMNRTMYILAIVAAIFLPLGLLTGLLGINVGGMPGAENDFAFWLVCVFLVFVAIGQFWLFKKMKWL